MNPLKTLSGLLLLCVSVASPSCSKELEPQNQDAQALLGGLIGPTVCSQKEVTLCAGQFTGVGAVLVETMSSGTTKITYQIKQSGWIFKEVQLFAGEAASMPVNKGGNPQIGNFPYKASFDPKSLITTYIFEINGLPSEYIVAAHATVLKTGDGTLITGSETAWGDGCGGIKITGGKGSWATLFDYVAEPCSLTEDPLGGAGEVVDTLVDGVGGVIGGVSRPQICSNSEYSFFNANCGLYDNWLDVNGDTTQNGQVTIGGQHYVEAEGECIYLNGAESTSRTAFMNLAVLKLSWTTYELDTELNASVVLVENWLQTLGKLDSATNLPSTADGDVLTALNYIKAWISSHPCPDR